MKHLVSFVSALALAIVLSACGPIYEKYGTTPEEVHKLAVEKVTSYAEDYVIKKIEASKDLSEEGKAKAKAEVLKVKEEALKKIEELKAKYDGAKAAKAVAPTK